MTGILIFWLSVVLTWIAAVCVGYAWGSRADKDRLRAFLSTGAAVVGWAALLVWWLM